MCSPRRLASLSRESATFFFFFNDTATTEIYTLSLHDALPIYGADGRVLWSDDASLTDHHFGENADRKSTRLNSSHVRISYAVFCLKKKKQHDAHRERRHDDSALFDVQSGGQERPHVIDHDVRR